MSKHQRKSHVHTTEITKSRTPAVTQLMSLLAEPSKLLGEVSDQITMSQGLGMSRAPSRAGAFSALSNLSPRFLGRCSLYQTIQCGGRAPSFARLSPHTPSTLTLQGEKDSHRSHLSAPRNAQRTPVAKRTQDIDVAKP